MRERLPEGPTTAPSAPRTAGVRSTGGRREPLPDRAPTAYSALLADVRRHGLLTKRPGYYVAVAAINAAVGVGCLVALRVLGPSPWQLVVAVVLGLVLAQFGFLAHEAAHRQVFERGPLNDLAARIVGPAVVGLSYSWWRDGHNRHHANPNVVGRDPSVDPSAFVFRPEDVPGRPALQRRLLRVQGWLMPPALVLEGLALRVTSLWALISRRPDRERAVDLVLLGLRLVALPALVLASLPLGLALAFLAVQSAVFGVYLGGSFIPNHVGMPVLEGRHGLDYLRKQVLTSRNIRGGRLASAITGGLNLQIEHHLFPGMPRPNLLPARAIVLEHCRAAGIPYTEVGATRAWRDVIRHLNAVDGRARSGFSCPVVEQCGRS